MGRRRRRVRRRQVLGGRGGARLRARESAATRHSARGAVEAGSVVVVFIFTCPRSGLVLLESATSARLARVASDGDEAATAKGVPQKESRAASGPKPARQGRGESEVSSAGGGLRGGECEMSWGGVFYLKDVARLHFSCALLPFKNCTPTSP